MRLAHVRVVALSVVGGCLLTLGALAGTAQAAVLRPGAASPSPGTSTSASANTDTNCQALPASSTSSPSPTPTPTRHRHRQSRRHRPRRRRRRRRPRPLPLRRLRRLPRARATTRAIPRHHPRRQPQRRPRHLAGSVALRVTLRVVELTACFSVVVPDLRLCRRLRFARCPPRREPEHQHQHQPEFDQHVCPTRTVRERPALAVQRQARPECRLHRAGLDREQRIGCERVGGPRRPAFQPEADVHQRMRQGRRNRRLHGQLRVGQAARGP